MIEILEVKDAETREKILLQNELGDDTVILQMTDRGAVLGSCYLKITGDKLCLLKLETGAYDYTSKPDTEQFFVLDSLVRSAASYGETKGAGQFETLFPDFFGFLKRMGFETDDQHVFGPIGTIVKYHA